MPETVDNNSGNGINYLCKWYKQSNFKIRLCLFKTKHSLKEFPRDWERAEKNLFGAIAEPA